ASSRVRHLPANARPDFADSEPIRGRAETRVKPRFPSWTQRNRGSVPIIVLLISAIGSCDRSFIADEEPLIGPKTLKTATNWPFLDIS
ncbi:MAG: hypothetical protein WBM54_08580, partial [Woeseia sp.]